MKNEKFGFTIIEILVVMAIIIIIGTFSVANYTGLKGQRLMESQVDKVTADLQATRERSKAQEGGAGWGIRFENTLDSNEDYYEIWTGGSYATGTVISRVNVSSGVVFSNPGSGSNFDVIFSGATGLPTASSTINLQSLQIDSFATITIDIQGKVDYILN